MWCVEYQDSSGLCQGLVTVQDARGDSGKEVGKRREGGMTWADGIWGS